MEYSSLSTLRTTQLLTGEPCSYVSDDSCKPDYDYLYKSRECFFQVLALYGSTSTHLSLGQDCVSTNRVIYFSQNYAKILGSSLFGGLLHQCKIQYFAEFQKAFISHTNMHCKYIDCSAGDTPYGPVDNSSRHERLVNGTTYLTNISNINLSDVSSEPVKICFCKNGLPDCTDQPGTIRVTKGKKFSVHLVAVDEVDNPVGATIHSYLSKTGGGFGSGQTEQNTSKTCSYGAGFQPVLS